MPQEKEFREALAAVLKSETFERSERLRKFLSFVCELVLAGQGEEINEHRIGIDVFERTADYSPSEDSIVRRQAHALRKKLEDYYRAEGKHSTVRIDLPLGHYAPVFRVCREERSVPSRTRSPQFALAAAGVTVFALGWLGGHLSRAFEITVLASENKASMQWLWRPWLNDPSGATICLTTPKTIVVKRYPEPHSESRSEQLIPENSARARTLRAFFDLEPGGELREYPSVGQAKMGEAVAAIRLTSLLASHQVAVRVERASSLGWDRARSENLIVFGHSESTPWVDRLVAGYPIRTEASQGALPRRITVASPQPGERPIYPLDESHPEEVYVLISMVPGPDGLHRLLAISGLSGMATQYGAEFLTTPAQVDSLAAALRQAGAKLDRGPTYFQVVLRVEVRDNTTPLKGKIELVRLIDRVRSSS